MKKLLLKNLITLSFALFGLGIIGYNLSYATNDPIGEIGDNPDDAPYCYSGGPGAASCSIEAGVEILGFGVAAGCSVVCFDGYYACCSLTCRCIDVEEG